MRKRERSRRLVAKVLPASRDWSDSKQLACYCCMAVRQKDCICRGEGYQVSLAWMQGKRDGRKLAGLTHWDEDMYFYKQHGMDTSNLEAMTDEQKAAYEDMCNSSEASSGNYWSWGKSQEEEADEDYSWLFDGSLDSADDGWVDEQWELVEI